MSRSSGPMLQAPQRSAEMFIDDMADEEEGGDGDLPMGEEDEEHEVRGSLAQRRKGTILEDDDEDAIGKY